MLWIFRLFCVTVTLCGIGVLLWTAGRNNFAGSQSEGALGEIEFRLPSGLLDGKRTPRLPNSPDEYNPIIAAYGNPEGYESTENDRPRPPIVLRYITYEPEGVRIFFSPDTLFGEPPPYQRWFVVGYLDTKMDLKISAGEAGERLRLRQNR